VERGKAGTAQNQDTDVQAEVDAILAGLGAARTGSSNASAPGEDALLYLILFG
jgi:hypothetical protein